MKSKIKIFILMFCLMTCYGIFYEKKGTNFAWGQDVNDLIREGRRLITFNLTAAHNRFQKAVEIQPTNQEANFFLASTRLLLLLQNEEVSLILARLGFTSFQFTSLQAPPKVTPPKELPSDSPSGKEFQILLRDTILPNIEKSLANLSVINEGFKTILKPEETGSREDAEVDFGDVPFSKALLNAISCFIQILSAYDFDIDIDDIISKMDASIFHPARDVLEAYPTLLTLINSPSLSAAKSSLIQAIVNYFEASEFIRNEDDDQRDDFIVFEREDLGREARFRMFLSNIRESLDRPTIFLESKNINIPVLDLTQFFDDPVNLRDFLPTFSFDPSKKRFEIISFPDPTFSGMLPNALNLDQSTISLKSSDMYSLGGRVNIDIVTKGRGEVDEYVLLFFPGAKGHFVSVTKPNTFGPLNEIMPLRKSSVLMSGKETILSFRVTSQVPSGLYSVIAFLLNPNTSIFDPDNFLKNLLSVHRVSFLIP